MLTVNIGTVQTELCFCDVVIATVIIPALAPNFCTFIISCGDDGCNKDFV